MSANLSVSRETLWKSLEAEVLKAIESKSLGKFSECAWLPGDASNRFYGRLHFQEKKTALVMVMNAPEAFKSEEVTGKAVAWKELPFVAIAKRFRQAGIRVPEILGVSPRSDFIVIEDLGDELLYDRRQKEPALIWYKKALEELAKIQMIGDLVNGTEFTRDLLTWETEHFVEYALLKRNKKVSDAMLKELRGFFAKVVESMASSQYVLVHRDFHSKNLLVLPDENRTAVIDFQDALWGPPTYDLASLLRDSYIRFDDKEEEELIQAFEDTSSSKVNRELFGYTSLQRNLKAVGRFFYISMVKGRDTHLPYVKPSLHRIYKTLRELGELRVLSIIEGLMQDEAR